MSFVDALGMEVKGGKCIPVTQVPGTVEYGYEYSEICHPNIPDECAPFTCAEAEQPAQLFAVTRITLASNLRESMGAGCYSTKNEPRKVTPGDVLAKLKTREIPKSAIKVQPPGGRTLVNFRTIVTSDSQPYSEDVTIFGQTVHLWIKPIEWTWDFGDGTDPLVQSDGGRAWQEGVGLSEITDELYTFHEYTDDETFGINLTVTWTADYKVEGSPDPIQSVPGSVGIASDSVSVEVVEAVPQLVESPAPS